jgi:glucokinase
MTWLVADIGGTNARFGLVERPNAAPTRIHVLTCRDHAGLAEAAATYLARYAGKPRPSAACVAVAGPTDGEHFRLTNTHWAGTASRIRDDLRLDHLDLINDFEALALSLPYLGGGDLRMIGAAPPRPGLPVAVLGPGTGLGVAGLVPTRDGWVPLPTEGGHVELTAGTEREARVLALLRAEYGVASAEALLCGDGLARLHLLLAQVHGVPADPRTAAEICARRGDPLCAEALRMFCALLGSFAGNVALTLGARGGVHLGGGILPRITDVLLASDFRHRFTAKPPMEGYLETIGTALIVAPAPALTGAAAWLGRRLPALETA